MLLPREQAEQILALHDQGMTLRAIAAQVGCAQHTVGGYIHRRTTPGRRATPKRALNDFVDYCRRRLTDDPDLTAPALFGELAALGYSGSRPTFYRDLGRYALLRSASPNVHPSEGRKLRFTPSVADTRSPQPLPVRVAPVAGERLGSYLARVAGGNHLMVEQLLAVLPAWIHRRLAHPRGHGTRHERVSRAEDALRQLSVLVGVTETALAHSLPTFTTVLSRGQPTGPIRRTTACRRCTAIRGIRQPVSVDLPSHTHVCVRHGIWLSSSDRPQLDINLCPEIIGAQKATWRLLRHLTPHQLVLAQVTAAHVVRADPDPGWHRRLRLLHAANPVLAGTIAEEELTHAATYPDALDRWWRQSPSRPQFGAREVSVPRRAHR
jgi:hypothetical protein